MYKCLFCNKEFKNPPVVTREVTMAGFKCTGQTEVCPDCGEDVFKLETD